MYTKYSWKKNKNCSFGSISEVVKDLKESSKHAKYLENISATQLENLLTRIQNNMDGIDTLPFLKPSTQNNDHNEDLNKLDDFELDKRKADMDKDFEKNRLRPGDNGFVYDKEVDFTGGKIESGWDDEDEYSDPDF